MSEAAAPRSTFREYLEALLIAGLFLGFTNTFVVKTFFIPSGSMEETLLVGDHLFVNRFVYGAAPTALERAILPERTPRRGDIVIFRSPKDVRQDLVKRLIGLPGDVVRIVDKRLYLNGRPVVDDSYTKHTDSHVSPAFTGGPRDNFGPFTVPPGHYFCMGDNRDQSYDSRYWGPVPQKLLKGRAFLIYWSFGGGTSDGTWPGWRKKLGELGRTLVGFPTKTRWSRTFQLPR